MAETAPLPEGWGAYQDNEGRIFYMNQATGQSSWEPPTAEAQPTYAPQPVVDPPYAEQQLPPGWAAHQDESGQLYYANASSGETSWTAPVAQAQAAPQWSTDYTYTLGEEGCEATFEGRALVLDKGMYTSVQATVDALNAGSINVEAGFCVIYSQSRMKYFLLWREDKEVEAFAQLGIQDDPPAAEPLWSTEQALRLGPEGIEQQFDGRALLLDRSVYGSLSVAVEALNAGQAVVDAGFCIVFSNSHQNYYLLWQWDKELLALQSLGLASASAPGG